MAVSDDTRSDKGRGPHPSKRSSDVGIFVFIFVILFWSFSVLRSNNLYMDEGMHLEEIMNFFAGKFILHQQLPQLPGYHLLIAGTTRLLNLVVMPEIRFVTGIFSMLTIYIFYKVARKIDADVAGVRTLQFTFFPIFFPFFFLIYTDTVSAMFVFIATYFALQKRINLSGLFWFASVMVRQNNIMWLPLLIFICLTDHERSLLYWHKGEKIMHFLKSKTRWNQVNDLLRKGWVFVVGTYIFLMFVAWNGGVAVGDKQAHPFPSFHLGNIYFLLAISFLFLLPLHIENFKRICNLFKGRKALVTMGSIMLFYPFYILTFVNSHYYNQGNEWLLRHRALTFFSHDIAHKTLFFIPITIALLSLWVTKLRSKEYYWLYPLTFVYLMLSWLIEQRYYLIFFGLFLLFRERRTWSEYAIAGIGVAVSLFLFVGVSKGTFFI